MTYEGSKLSMTCFLSLFLCFKNERSTRYDGAHLLVPKVRRERQAELEASECHSETLSQNIVNKIENKARRRLVWTFSELQVSRWVLYFCEKSPSIPELLRLAVEWQVNVAFPCESSVLHIHSNIVESRSACSHCLEMCSAYVSGGWPLL